MIHCSGISFGWSKVWHIPNIGLPSHRDEQVQCYLGCGHFVWRFSFRVIEPGGDMVKFYNICQNCSSSGWCIIVACVSISVLGFIIDSLRPSDAIWRQRSWTTLVQVMACCLTAPSHHLNQCWLIISDFAMMRGYQYISSGYRTIEVRLCR